MRAAPLACLALACLTTACGAPPEVAGAPRPPVWSPPAPASVQPTPAPPPTATTNAGAGGTIAGEAPNPAPLPEALDPDVIPAGVKPSGFVAVWADATFFVEPRDDAATLAMATFEGDTRRQRLGQTIPFVVRGAAGDFVEVSAVPLTRPEPPYLPDADAHCSWFAFSTNELVTDLTLYVRRRDLAPVLAQPLERAFPDGTRHRFAPGTPVLRATSGVLAFMPTAVVPVADAPLAFSYATAPPPFQLIGPASKFRVTRTDVDLRLGGLPFRLRDRLFTPLAGEIQERGDSVLFPLRSRCGEHLVEIPASAVGRYREPSHGSGGGTALGIGGIGTGFGSAQTRKVQKGTVLRTADKRPAAKLARDLYLTADQAPCVDVHPRASSVFLASPKVERPAIALRLCADPKAIQPHQWFTPGGERLQGLKRGARPAGTR